MTSTAAGRPLARLVRDRRSRIYLGGQIVSIFGDTMLFLAAGIWVRELTGSDSAAAATFFFLAVPSLASPLVGLLVDRVRRKRLLILMNVGIGVGVLALLFVRDAGDVWIIYVVIALYGLATTVIQAAQSALLVSVVDDDLLADANGLLQTFQQGVRVLSPLTGVGLFTAFGMGAVATLDAVSFLVAAGSLLLIHVDEGPDARDHAVSLRAELAAGFLCIRADAVLRRLIGVSAVVWFGMGIVQDCVFAVLTTGLGQEPDFVGVLSSSQGVGAILGGIVVAPLMRRAGEMRVTGLGAAGLAIGTALWMVPDPSVAAGGSVLLGLGVSLLVVGAGTLVQRRSPERLLGRVFAAYDASVSLPQTIALASGALLVAHVSYLLLLGVVAAAFVLAAAALLVMGGNRGAEPGPSVADAPA